MQGEQIIIAKTGEDRYCLVKVPEGAYRFYSAKDGIVSGSVGMDVSKRLPDGALSLTGDRINIEKGNWQIVGIGKDLTEDQWKEIVESKRFYDGDGDHSMGMVTYYREYPNDIGESALLSATESGFSYLRSHGADENYLILKEVK